MKAAGNRGLSPIILETGNATMKAAGNRGLSPIILIQRGNNRSACFHAQTIGAGFSINPQTKLLGQNTPPQNT